MSAGDGQSGSSPDVIGKPQVRVDGRRKVTGQADYAADRVPEHVAYAYPVMSTIANGRISAVDTRAAEAAPGVLAVYHHGRFADLSRAINDFSRQTRAGETRPPFADDKIYYAGQYVAVVVAERFEQARAAAALVEVNYAPQDPVVTMAEGLDKHGSEARDDNSSRGDPEGAFTAAAVTHDATYSTPIETHNPMELHATVAEWRDGRLTVYESTQGVVFQRNVMAQMLGIPKDRVDIRSPFIGSGFGGKLFMWPHALLAAVAARELQRPVKLVVPRAAMFSSTGHRGSTRQRIRLGCDDGGALTSVRHDTHCQTSFIDDFVESCGETTKSLYACRNLGVTHRVVQLHMGTPTPMRAPGATPGLFALESAMDELAIKLKMDPIELRLANYGERDQAHDRPWSSIHLKECFEVGAERFGWQHRQAEPGSMREGDEIIGMGMAACSWPALRSPCSARVALRADGSAVVSCATQDIGTGTYTVIAQTVAQVTGLAIDDIEVRLGDSAFPPGPLSGGSMVTATVMPAVAKAARDVLDRLREAAVEDGGALHGVKADKLKVDRGALVADDGDRRASFAEILDARGLSSLEGEGDAAPGDEAKKYSFRSFGAHFIEVRWDPGISRLRVARAFSAIDAGRVVNPPAARNQITGAVVMGIGMALLEHTVYDTRNGRVVTDNLADYLMPVHADMPEIDVAFLDHPDPHINEFGARGLGEIGITGLAAAVANAVYHATGKRIRDLPITLDKLMS